MSSPSNCLRSVALDSGKAETTVPTPGRVSSRPAETKCITTLWAVLGLTFSSLLRVRTEGKISPDATGPRWQPGWRRKRSARKTKRPSEIGRGRESRAYYNRWYRREAKRHNVIVGVAGTPLSRDVSRNKVTFSGTQCHNFLAVRRRFFWGKSDMRPLFAPMLFK